MNWHKELITDYKELLKECFQTDSELINTWHLTAGEGLEKCVKKTYDDLQKYNITIYKIMKNNKLVGYFGKENLDEYEFLTGFFLIPEFRNKKDRQEFWSLIKKEFKKPFFCGLYEKNIPANRFIKSQGGILIQHPKVLDNPGCLYRIEE